MALFQIPEETLEAVAGNPEVLHYLGAALGLGMVVIGAGMGIGKLANCNFQLIALRNRKSLTNPMTEAVDVLIFFPLVILINLCLGL